VRPAATTAGARRRSARPTAPACPARAARRRGHRRGRLTHGPRGGTHRRVFRPRPCLRGQGAQKLYLERGLLNPDKLKSYNNHGTRGVDEPARLLKLMANCEDFTTETTAMHKLMALLGIGMEQTSKGHLELAGRGIEYCWSKGKYGFRKHNNFVSSKENFEKRVTTALKSVMLRRSRAFQQKANDYKRVYRMLMDGFGVETAVALYIGIEKNARSRKNSPLYAARPTQTTSLLLALAPE
jgi:hypothetical protein